jgi:hypothetical protein
MSRSLAATARTVATAVAAVVALLALVGVAQASSIVFIKDHNVWVSAPDGSGQRQLTTDGTSALAYESPSQADDGTILAGRGLRFVKLDREGRQIGEPLPSILVGKPANAYAVGPFAPKISPDGTKLAYWIGTWSTWFDHGTSPTWAPDGAALAWTEGDGIWTTPVGALDSADCSWAAPRLTIPGGSQPDWGPAGASAIGGPAAGGSRVAGTTRRYAGQIELFSRPGRRVRTATQGDGWQAVFRERARGAVRYRVCVRKAGSARVRRCWSRRSGRDGRSRVTIALFVNDRGGAGRYTATWTVRGRTVATAAFRVRPEPTGP